MKLLIEFSASPENQVRACSFSVSTKSWQYPASLSSGASLALATAMLKAVRCSTGSPPGLYYGRRNLSIFRSLTSVSSSVKGVRDVEAMTLSISSTALVAWWILELICWKFNLSSAISRTVEGSDAAGRASAKRVSAGSAGFIVRPSVGVGTVCVEEVTTEWLRVAGGCAEGSDDGGELVICRLLDLFLMSESRYD